MVSRVHGTVGPFTGYDVYSLFLKRVVEAGQFVHVVRAILLFKVKGSELDVPTK